MRAQLALVSAAVVLGLLTLLIPSPGVRLVLLTIIGLALIVVVVVRG